MERELPICLLLRTGARILFDVDCNLLRYHERLEGKVLGIAQHKLKRVLARWKRQRDFGLSATKVPMLLVGRNRLLHLVR